MTINWNLRNSYLGKIIKNVNFDEIPGFELGIFGVWDQHTTTALFLSLNCAAKKLVFINGTYIFVKSI